MAEIIPEVSGKETSAGNNSFLSIVGEAAFSGATFGYNKEIQNAWNKADACQGQGVADWTKWLILAVGTVGNAHKVCEIEKLMSAPKTPERKCGE